MEDVHMEDGYNSSASSRHSVTTRPSLRSAKSKRRPSTILVESKNASSDDLLSPRTPKHIGKSSPLPRSSSRSDLQHRSSYEDHQLGTRRTALPANLTTQQHLFSESNMLAVETPVRYRTPSISSIASLSSRSSVPTFDVQTLYKIKTSNSTKKLNSFFGEMPPMDICLKEIEREGLKAMLQSKVPLCYFLHTVLEEYSSENLFFYIEVDHYESFTYVNKEQQLATAEHIYETYLTRNSQFEVNLEDKVRKTVMAALQDPEGAKDCFSAAKRAVFVLLEGSFQKFKANGSWDNMIKDTGELSTHYDEVTRNKAVNKLLRYIERQHDLLYTNPYTDQLISNTSRRRNELLKSMVHEFCRTLLGVEFNYYRPESSDRRRHIPQVASPMNSDNEGSASDGEIRRPTSPKLRERSKSFVAKRSKQIDALFGKKGKPGAKA